ncbi:hypothetical protein C7999DRAFT_44958 [Corynascus novoguineensis]|uniref:Rhodopsin domain-containing protein n=1 Tax=Corynascus novoguineensis TaxID=1126955 RepID=A0AAN7HIH3_9PEZI|nr:hypothetical protein C7999DRAFT_44958 [Corynascus novoguineensis]
MLTNINTIVLASQSKVPATIAISVSLPTLSTLAVSLRLYTRRFILGWIGPDDWLIVIALVLAISTSVAIILEAFRGMGTHVWTVTPVMLLEQMKALYASILTYNMANNIIKMSFLLQYRRIFGSSSPTADRVCYWFFFFIMLWAIMQAILLSVACIPVAKIVPIMAGKCLDTLPVWCFSAGLNIITDFFIFAIPLPFVYNLTMQIRQKVLVFTIFSFGFFTCIISIIRLIYLRIVTVTEDLTWDNVELTLWSIGELNSGIVCASVQTLRPLISRFILGLTPSSSTEGSRAHTLSELIPHTVVS